MFVSMTRVKTFFSDIFDFFENIAFGEFIGFKSSKD
jgi:hypothetical protein